jgi:hypothetical protein
VPDPSVNESYEKVYKRYRALYPALAQEFKALANLGA